ncbi:MAG: hypothetical protein V4485_00630 [Pseudomonadota bacterium]
MVYDRNVYIDLTNRVNSEDPEFLANFLAKYKDLDITYSNGRNFDYGTLLIAAVEGDTKRGNTKITKLLIQYYETMQLPKLIKNSPEYNNIQCRFKESLVLAIDGEKISEEMRKLLSPYIDFNPEEYDSLDDNTVCNEDAAKLTEELYNTNDDHNTSNTLTAEAINLCGRGPASEVEAMHSWLSGSCAPSSANSELEA